MARANRLSTQEIMRLSTEKFNKISSQQCIDISVIQKLFDSTHEFNLSDEEIKNAELALVLIASAHKVSNKHFNDARKLLNLCDFLSSSKGNAVQRVVYYFSKALQERIAREMGIISLNESKTEETTPSSHPFDSMDMHPALISCCLQLPCVQVVQLAGIQTIIDSLASARKVHFIDLAIRSGVHCPVLMQALANQHECPIQLLRITAVGLSETKQKIEEVGKCLTRFAETLNFPFSFEAAIVANIKDLKQEIVFSNDEVVAVFAQSVLRMIKAKPDCLKSLLRVLRSLNPCVFVIVEPEANHNSPIFIDRFLESLFYYSASFDCIDACIDETDQNRLALEARVGVEISDIIAAEDEERIFRHMKINEWRDNFAKFKMVETEISISSLHHADVLLKNLACGKSCSLVKNGKCLVNCWKGTPLVSLSAWKFHK